MYWLESVATLVVIVLVWVVYAWFTRGRCKLHRKSSLKAVGDRHNSLRPSEHEKGNEMSPIMKFYGERQGPDNNGFFYRCRLVILASRAFPNTNLQIREALVRRQFIRGLWSDRIRSKVIESNEKSMSRILDIVKDCERSITPPPPEPVFNQINQTVFQEHPRRPKLIDNRQVQTVDQVECWKCLLHGHRARNCPNDRQGLSLASSSVRRPVQ